MLSTRGPAAAQDVHDAADELGRLACAGRRFDDERLVERGGNHLPRVGIGQLHVVQRLAVLRRLRPLRVLPFHGFSRSASRSPSFSRHLLRHARALVGAADGQEVAPRAGALAGRGRQKAEFDRAIDDLERLEAGPPVLLVERNRVIGEAAGRGAIEQAPRLDRLVQCALHRQSIEHRLQDRAAADHGLPGRPVLARLVIRDAQVAALCFDQVDRAAQQETAVDEDGVRHARRIAAPVARQPERELEIGGRPTVVERQPADPHAQIPPDVGDLVLPHPRNRWSELVPVACGNRRECGVDGRERVRPRPPVSAAAVLRLSAGGKTPPAPRGRSIRASADRSSAMARCLSSARGGESPRAGTGTGRPRISAVPTANRGERPRRLRSRIGFVVPVTRVSPSYCVHCARPRAQRALTERFRHSFRRSR